MSIANFLKGVGVIAVIALIYNWMVALPDSQVKDAESLKVIIASYDKKVAKQDELLATMKKGKDWSFYSPYAGKELWSKNIDNARFDVSEANKLYNAKITPILDRDHEDDSSALNKYMKTARVSLAKALKSAYLPSKRASLLMDGYKNKDKYFEHANKIKAQSIADIAKFNNGTEKYKVDYPKKVKAINDKVAALNKLGAAVYVSHGIMSAQYKSTSTDFSVYSKAYNAIKKEQNTLVDYMTKGIRHLKQLNRSYVKVLVDMKVDYYVKIGRASWCESDGCGDGDSYSYPPIKVDEKTHAFYDETNISPIAKDGYGSANVNVPSNHWSALKLDIGRGMSGYHSYYELWVEGTETSTYHKYKIMEDGKITTTQWQTVDEKFFWDNYDNLGMALATKPLGVFESETNKIAEPAGLALVAKPVMVNGKPTGSNQYGEWQTNPSGNSFFHYYGMYRMAGDLIGGGLYGYNDYDHYSRRSRSKSYYGSSRQFGTSGSRTMKQSSLKNSNFVKRNPSVYSNAGKSRGSKSIRGAGSSNRGKGPGGSGK
tara:strand:+ start:3780 stop:5405 length:1626 start_codon:yes stop_codon:yes gene_type:complete